MKTTNDFIRFEAKMIDGKIMPYSVETWLPLFPGFYNSWLESDIAEDLALEFINENRNESNLPPVKRDDITFNYDDYYKRVAKAFLNEVEAKLIELKIVSEIRFQKVVSPKYYNYSNDSVNCEVILRPYNGEALQKYIFENRENLSEYLRAEYTSCSGFISSYSNNFEDWQAETEDFLNWERNAHHLGSILQFILLNEGVTTEGICENICEETSYIDAVVY